MLKRTTYKIHLKLQICLLLVVGWDGVRSVNTIGW